VDGVDDDASTRKGFVWGPVNGRPQYSSDEGGAERWSFDYICHDAASSGLRMKGRDRQLQPSSLQRESRRGVLRL
jgi:hypothetical protein